MQRLLPEVKTVGLIYNAGEANSVIQIDMAKEAMEDLAIEPLVCPIRGGTDGANLSYKGLPCPNLCTGGHNFHGKYEYISIQAMEKVTELLIAIVQKVEKMSSLYFSSIPPYSSPPALKL